MSPLLTAQNPGFLPEWYHLRVLTELSNSVPSLHSTEEAEEKLEKRSEYAIQGIDYNKVVQRVVEVMRTSSVEVLARNRKRQTVKARSLLVIGTQGNWVLVKHGSRNS